MFSFDISFWLYVGVCVLIERLFCLCIYRFYVNVIEPVPWAISDAEWVAPTSPPDPETFKLIFDHLIAYHGKGLNIEWSSDRVQESLEYIIPLLAPSIFNKLRRFSKRGLKRNNHLLRILANSDECGDGISDALKFNSPSSDWYHTRGHKSSLHTRPATFSQTSNRTIRSRCFCPSLGIAIGLLWSPPVNDVGAAAIKKRLGIEAVHHPMHMWRLEYIGMKYDNQAWGMVQAMCIWHKSLEGAMAEFDRVCRADDKASPPPK